MVFSSASSSAVKGKSPLVQKNATSRLAKKNDQDREWLSNTAVQQKKPIENTKLSTTYVKAVDKGNSTEKTSPQTDLDAEKGSQFQRKSSLASSSEQRRAPAVTKPKSEVEMGNDASDYVKYEEVDEEALRREEVARVRKLSEEGPIGFQLLAFFGGVAMVFTSILDFQNRLFVEGMAVDFTIVSMYTWIFGVLIMGIEGRVVMIDVPALHRAVSGYLKILRFLWGRGLFLIFAGSLQFCLLAPYSIICGSSMMVLGLVMFSFGVLFKVLLNRKLQNFPDEGKIQEKFEFFDTDKDGYLDKEQFRDFVISISLHEYEDLDEYEEFESIDDNNDGLVNFVEVKKWVDTMNYRKQTLMDTFANAATFFV